VPQGILDINFGISWKQFVLEHPDLSLGGLNIDVTEVKPDPEKPGEILVQYLANPAGFVAYSFSGGSLQGVTFTHTSGVEDRAAFLMEARRLFGDSPIIKERAISPDRKIYCWKDQNRLIELLVPLKKGHVSLRIFSLALAKEKGLDTN